jgi:hypothetical protein
MIKMIEKFFDHDGLFDVILKFSPVLVLWLCGVPYYWVIAVLVLIFHTNHVKDMENRMERLEAHATYERSARR